MAITFSKSQPAPTEQFAQPDLGSFERRIRTLEESVTHLRRIVQVTEENILIKSRHTSTDIKAHSSDINELRRELHQLQEKMLLVLKEMQSLARQEDVKVLERYISLWSPVRFVTQSEVEGIVDEILIKKIQRKQPDSSDEQ